MSRSFASFWPGFGTGGALKRDLSNLAPHPDSSKHTKFVRADGTFADPGATGAAAGVDFHASTNSSGNTTISPAADTGKHIEETTVSGSGSTTRIMILDVAQSPTAGAIIVHRVELPATAAITLEWRDATSAGTLLTSFVTDGSGDDVVAEFYYNGSAWKFLRFNAPANA